MHDNPGMNTCKFYMLATYDLLRLLQGSFGPFAQSRNKSPKMASRGLSALGVKKSKKSQKSPKVKSQKTVNIEPECTAVAAKPLQMRMRILTRPENSLANFNHQISNKKLRIKCCPKNLLRLFFENNLARQILTSKIKNSLARLFLRLF